MGFARGAVSGGAVLLDDGRILAMGGRDTNGILATADVYDPLTSQ